MKLKCAKLSAGVQSAIFMWEETLDGKKSKTVKSVSLDQTIEVEDSVGHVIIAKYPDNFRVESYGPSVATKSVTPPKTMMLKQEQTKGDSST